MLYLKRRQYIKQHARLYLWQITKEQIDQSQKF